METVDFSALFGLHCEEEDASNQADAGPQLAASSSGFDGDGPASGSPDSPDDSLAGVSPSSIFVPGLIEIPQKKRGRPRTRPLPSVVDPVNPVSAVIPESAKSKGVFTQNSRKRRWSERSGATQHCDSQSCDALSSISRAETGQLTGGSLSLNFAAASESLKTNLASNFNCALLEKIDLLASTLWTTDTMRGGYKRAADLLGMSPYMVRVGMDRLASLALRSVNVASGAVLTALFFGCGNLIFDLSFHISFSLYLYLL